MRNTEGSYENMEGPYETTQGPYETDGGSIQQTVLGGKSRTSNPYETLILSSDLQFLATAMRCLQSICTIRKSEGPYKTTKGPYEITESIRLRKVQEYTSMNYTKYFRQKFGFSMFRVGPPLFPMDPPCFVWALRSFIWTP